MTFDELKLLDSHIIYNVRYGRYIEVCICVIKFRINCMHEQFINTSKEDECQ